MTSDAYLYYRTKTDFVNHFMKKKGLNKRQIEKTDKKIDMLVYDLYDLTPEEIKIVEDSMK
ncbi:MAG: hypothetical protein R2883_01160 [Caldisericia bacterium]